MVLVVMLAVLVLAWQSCHPPGNTLTACYSIGVSLLHSIAPDDTHSFNLYL